MKVLSGMINAVSIPDQAAIFSGITVVAVLIVHCYQSLLKKTFLYASS